MVLTVSMCDNNSGARIAVERALNMKQSRQKIKDDILYFVGQMLYGIEVQVMPNAFNTYDVFAEIKDLISDSFDGLTEAGLKSKSTLCSIIIGQFVFNVNIEKPKLVAAIKVK